MSLARRLLLGASRSAWLAEQLRRRAFFRRAVRRFLPGEDLGAALDAAARFAGAGLGSVLTELGENVTTRAEAEAVRDHYLEVLERARQRDLAAHISVKPTHLGLDLDREQCGRAVVALAERAAETGAFLWIDMEDSRYVDATLALYRQARSAQACVGVCLQAYLHRTPRDLAALLPLQPAIRLVKGAYNEPQAVALARKRDVDARYVELAEQLLEAARRGAARVVFGTHDAKLLGRIRERALTLGLARNGYEVHMLYGIRPTEQRALAAEGVGVRVLISYGTAWFAWYMRRLAERPANVWFVLRNLI